MSKIQQIPSAQKYLAFPFLSSIQQFVINEIEYRQSNRNVPKTAFIKVTPGAKIEGQDTPIFKGIISEGEGNSPAALTFDSLYNKSIAFRPIAGLKSVTVDYKNITGAVRKATVSWTCHSLDDLEALAPYYLHPGMTILLEWGWSDITPGIINMSDIYGDNFTLDNYYSKVQSNIEDSNCRYDAMLGYIVNFTVNLRRDGGFDCTTDVYSVGDIMQGLILVQQRDSAYGSGQNSYNEKNPQTLKDAISSYLDYLIADDLNKINTAHPDWYVWNPAPQSKVKGTNDKNDQLNSPTYLTWGYIEDNIINKYLAILFNSPKAAGGKRALYGFDSSNSTIGWHDNLRTTNLAICILNPNDAVHPSQSKPYFPPRKILVNAQVLKSAIDRSVDPIGFVTAILTEINNACANYWELRLQPTSESDTQNETKPLLTSYAIVDMKFIDEKVYRAANSIYVFKVKPFSNANADHGPQSSIIKDIKLTTTLSNSIALNVFYRSHMDKNPTNKIVNGNPVIYDSLFSANVTDRFFKGSMTNIAPIDTSKTTQDQKKDLPDFILKNEGDQAGYDAALKVYLPLTEYGYHPRVDVTDANGKTTSTEIVVDNIDTAREMMRSLTNATSDKIRPSSNDAMVPFKLEIDLEGISGLRPGDIFRLDYFPKRYSDVGTFQITNVIQNVDKNGWFTKIIAAYRVISPNKFLP